MKKKIQRTVVFIITLLALGISISVMASDTAVLAASVPIQSIRIQRMATGNESKTSLKCTFSSADQEFDVKHLGKRVETVHGKVYSFFATSPGVLYLGIKEAVKTESYGRTFAMVFGDSTFMEYMRGNNAENNSYNSLLYANQSNKLLTDSMFFSLPKSGYYYIVVYSTGASEIDYPELAEKTELNMEAAFYSSSNATLNDKCFTAVGLTRPEEHTYYFKYVPAKTGYMELEGDNFYSRISRATFTLCDKSKKPISPTTGTFYQYGVSRLTTYYLKMTVPQGNSVSRITTFQLKPKVTGVSEKSGKSKGKAVALKKNKTVKGTVEAGNLKADWYKIKMTKTGRLKINLNLPGRASGKIKMYVYNSKNNKVASGTAYFDTDTWNTSKAQIKINKKVPKGNYYVKICGSNKLSSGYYTLKWSK